MLTNEQIKIANELTREAGRRLAGFFKDPGYRKPVIKEDGSPVTLADIEVSHFLIDKLSELGFPVVSEEGPLEVEGENYFIVDPLDGTKYFVRGEREFATCVGFIEKGVSTYGAVCNPLEETLYYGIKGGGAWKNGQTISRPGPQKDLVAFSRGFHKRPAGQAFMKELNITEIKFKGAALKFCGVAEGEADLFPCFGPTGEWDTAAVQVILEEAGCTIFVAKTGKTLTYGKKDRMNPEIIVCHQDLKEKIISVLGKSKEPFGSNWQTNRR